MFGARKLDGTHTGDSGLSSSPSWRCVLRHRRLPDHEPKTADKYLDRRFFSNVFFGTPWRLSHISFPGCRLFSAATIAVDNRFLQLRVRPRSPVPMTFRCRSSRTLRTQPERPDTHLVQFSAPLFGRSKTTPGITRAPFRASCTTVTTSTRAAPPLRLRRTPRMLCNAPCLPLIWCVSVQFDPPAVSPRRLLRRRVAGSRIFSGVAANA